MLDGILGRNFSAKCKASIKLIRTRIDVIRRKRNATQKFLKKDVADLLANGLDINAYGRAEGLIAELTISSCYDFIEKSCECVLKHLSVMLKPSECPEECRSAVASLMFAAARFSDLPELRDLRHVFLERYGNGLECYVNQKFVENLASNPSTTENKIQLMNSIASEFSIKWDSRAFERTIYKAPVCVQEQPKQYRLFNAINENQKTPNCTYTILKVNKPDAVPKERPEVTSNGHLLHAKKEDAAPKRENLDNPFLSRQEISANGNKPVNGRGDSNTLRHGREILFNGREEPAIKWPKIVAMNEVESKPVTHGLGSSIGKRDEESTNGGYKLHNGQEKFPIASKINHAGRDSTYGGDHKVPGSPSGGKRPEPVDGGGYALQKEQFIKGDELDIPFAPRVDGAADHKGASNSSRGIRLESNDDGYTFRNLQPNKDDNWDILLASKKKHPGRDNNCVGEHNNREMPFASTNNHRIRYDDYADEHEVAYLVQKARAEKADGLKLYNNSIPPPYGNSIHKVQAETKDESKPYYNAIPPPYVKPPRDTKRGTSLGSNDPVFDYDDLNRSSAGEKSEKILFGSDHGRDKQYKLHHDEIAGDILPTPRSVRRRYSKASSSNTYINNSEERRHIRRITSGRRRGDPRQDLQIAINGEDEQNYHKDEEERMMDRLLLHYSKKPTIYNEPEMFNRKVKAYPLDNKIKHDQDERLVVPPPTRSTSLPPEHPGPSEVQKLYARAASFQPVRSNPAQHVHPKLPDYDDLAARFAALKGR